MGAKVAVIRGREERDVSKKSRLVTQFPPSLRICALGEPGRDSRWASPRHANRGLRSGTLPPMPLPDGPTLFVIAAAVGLVLVWWAGRDTGAS